MNINYQSDFKIVERLLPDATFRYTYYVSKDKGSVVAEYDGTTYSGCLADGDRLIVPIDGGTLGIGYVKVKREYYLDDNAFTDGVCNLVSVEATDIELGKGRTDSDIEADVKVGVYYKTFTFEDMTEEQKQEIADRVPTNELEREENETMREANEREREGNESKREENERKRQEGYANKVDRDDYAPKLTSGFSDNLVGRGEATPEVIGFRPSGVKSILDGTARMDRLKGNTLVWNQRLPYELNKWSGRFGSTITLENGVLTSKSNYPYLRTKWNIPVGNKFVFTADVCINVGTLVVLYNYAQSTSYAAYNNLEANKNVTISGIFDCKDVGGICLIAGNQTDAISISRFLVVDLTQMFGAGNEPTTIEEFNARKPLGIDEYAYNEGELISTTADEIKSVGFNAWDEEWENGLLTNSGDMVYPSAIRSKNYIEVIPQATYIFGCPNKTGNGIAFYDTEKKIIGKLVPTEPNTAFTTPAECRYMRFDVSSSYGNTYNHDICIHLVHTGIRNGQYEPYKEFRLPLPIKDIKDKDGNQLFPNGLLSAGTAYDEITATKAIKRIGVVDMGSLKWTRYQFSEGYYYFRHDSDDIAIGNYNVLANLVCAQYATVKTGTGHLITTNTITNYLENGLFLVRDDSYTDADTFKAAMSGVMLYYELAEPIEVDLPEPLNLDYEVSDFGTEEVLSDTRTAPLKADIVYQFNAVDRIRETDITLADLIKRVAALEATNAALVQQINDNSNG